jgi:membrane protease YdiL (CAAX protease family)
MSQLPDAALSSAKGHPVLAWIVIAAAVVFLTLILPHLRPAAAEAATDHETHSALMEMQARGILGTALVFGHKESEVYSQAQTLDRGSFMDRLRFVALAGELVGPEEAHDRLSDLETARQVGQLEASDRAVETAALLERLYTDYEAGRWQAPSLAPSDRMEVRQRLGWFGELALAPEQGPDQAARAAVLGAARRTALTWLLAAGAALLFGFAGLVLLIVLIVLLASGQLQARFRAGSVYGGVYAEAFAVWMVLYPLLGLLAGWLDLGQSQLLGSGAAMVLSMLAALSWPVLRGIPWQRVRNDTGLFFGRNPVQGPLLGLTGYLATLPALAVALLVTLVLTRFLAGVGPESGSPGPSHPIVGYILEGNGWVRFQVVLVAAVLAPLVEETLFRGFLYRQLRESTRSLGRAGSVLLSGVVVSFVFAVIHPQGPLGLPVLMTLAFAFALLREWRGSLTPSMTAHAINNLGVTLLLFAAA